MPSPPGRPLGVQTSVCQESGSRGSGSKSPVFVGNGGRQASGLTVGGVFTSTDQCVPTLREAAPP